MSSVVLFFGQYLVSEGHVTQSQLDEAVQFQEQHNLPLGAVALSKALMSERQVLIVHAPAAIASGRAPTGTHRPERTP